MNQSISLTEEEWSGIDERVAAATPGPWIAHVEGRDFDSGSSCIATGGEDAIEMSGAVEADYDFIAHARQDVPKLVAEVRRLRALPGLS